jgi:hypothetical protein
MNTNQSLRPRDFALLLLALGDLLPRKRARDQAPDLAGLALERRILDRLAALDSDSDDLEATLLRIVEEIGPPTGPTRAVAIHVRDEFLAVRASPDLAEHLLTQATRQGEEGKRSGR